MPTSADQVPTPVRILVAEDEPHIRRILAAIFDDRRFTLDQVADGRLAIEALRGNTPYDLVLLDLLMPEASGLDVLREIRSLPHRLRTPVIVLTAKGQDADRQRALSLGANEFLTKPFSPKKLLTTVDEILGAP